MYFNSKRIRRIINTYPMVLCRILSYAVGWTSPSGMAI